MRAVRYDRFSGVDHLYIADIPEPSAGAGEVVISVRAAGLNPGALPALHGAPYVPGRDLAGEVVAVGPGVDRFAVGDEVMGRVQSWDAHAPRVAMPVAEMIVKPAELSWDVAASLFTTPMAALGAIRAVEPKPGELVAISGASGGVGFTAAQLAVRAGARVLGLTSAARADLLRAHGVEPVEYGDGQEDRLRTAAGDDPIDAFIDAVGGGYIELALRLGVQPGRIDTVVDYAGAAQHGVKAWGTNDAGGVEGFAELAHMATEGTLAVPIAATFALDAVQDAYRALADRRSHGRIVLHPQQ